MDETVEDGGGVKGIVASGRRGELYGAALDELRRLITSGVLPPGHRLREQELGTALGVSRTPLREAIRTLATEGLVELSPNRGAVVSALDAKGVEALYQVVGTLEALAVELGCARITDVEIEDIRHLQRALVAHHAAGDLAAYFDVNQQIHRRLVEMSGNPVLLWVWDMLALRVNRARYATNLRPERWTEAVAEHEALCAALASRDGPLMARLIREHFARGLQAISPHLAAGPGGQ